MLKFSFVCRFVKVLVVEVEVERVVVVDGAVEETWKRENGRWCGKKFNVESL